MPNIRPNCPPPKRPIVEPGGISVFMHSNLKRSGTHGKNSRSEEFRSQESGVRSTPRASAREDLRRNSHSADLAVFREVRSQGVKELQELQEFRSPEANTDGREQIL